MSLRQIFQRSEAHAEPPADGPQSGPFIQLKHVTREYQAGRRIIKALNDVNLIIREGEYVSIVGSSGSGKSTLLNMISGIDVPDAGYVEVQGQQLKGMSENQLAAWRGTNVGIVFQFFQLMPTLTIRENIILPMDLSGQSDEKWARADRLLESVGIEHLSSNLPSELSGGEQQRAAIARALANGPGVLIADEPTGNLDTTNGQVVVDILEELWRQGTTLIVVTHDRELARRAPRRVSMRDGEIIQDETIDSQLESVIGSLRHVNAR